MQTMMVEVVEMLYDFEMISVSKVFWQVDGKPDNREISATFTDCRLIKVFAVISRQIIVLAMFYIINELNRLSS
ncbi:hypothetical protein [Levilactobacillus spicheri]|uniref:hypothetical protein n=1 Tax=Levilactobacillus spicheri TaxID=216463 RepID=UPI00177C6C6E|nr:hypothetical protein [Levilactobacillus spicheri]